MHVKPSVMLAWAPWRDTNDLRRCLQGSYMTGGLITQPSEWRSLGLFVGISGGLAGGFLLYTKFTSVQQRRRHKRALASLAKDD